VDLRCFVLFGQDASTDISGHLNARVVQLDLGNIVPGSPPHSPLDKSARGMNGVSPGRSEGAASPPPGAPASTGTSNLRSMSNTRKAKFKKLLDQQVSCPHLLDQRQDGLLSAKTVSHTLPDKEVFCMQPYARGTSKRACM